MVDDPKYPISETDAADMAKRFTYRGPTSSEQVERHHRVSGQSQSLAEFYLMNVPPGRERALAITKLEEAAMWASAGIARGE